MAEQDVTTDNVSQSNMQTRVKSENVPVAEELTENEKLEMHAKFKIWLGENLTEKQCQQIKVRLLSQVGAAVKEKLKTPLEIIDKLESMCIIDIGEYSKIAEFFEEVKEASLKKEVLRREKEFSPLC